MSDLALCTPSAVLAVSYTTNRMAFCGTTLMVLAAQPLLNV